MEAVETINSMNEAELAAQIEGMKDDPDAWGEPDPAPGKSSRRSERRRRGAVVSVRLTVDELERVQAYAHNRGLSLSGALRTAALEAAQRATKVVAPWFKSTAAVNGTSDTQKITSDVHSSFYVVKAS